LKEVWSLEGWGRSFDDALLWRIGDGKRICFWEDNWVSCDALKCVFSRLFSLSTSKAFKLVEFGGWSNNLGVAFSLEKDSF